MAKEWKESQKIADKLQVELDDFYVAMDERVETYTTGGFDASLPGADPIIQQYKTMMETLNTYTWAQTL